MTQPLEMNATQARSVAVRRYFTKTPSRPSYFVAVMLGLNAVAFTLITLWIVMAIKEAEQASPPPPPIPQETAQQQPPQPTEPKQPRRGNRRRRQAEQKRTTQQPATQSTESTTAQSTTNQTASAPPAQSQQQPPATNCVSCAAMASGAIAVLSALLAAGSYTLRRRAYVRAWHNAEPKPSDHQIDAWHAADIDWLKKHALGRLDLVREQVEALRGPLLVVGSGPSPQFRRGQDRRVRFSSHEVLIIYLTDYHLAAFKCVIDLHDGGIRTETTQEYHYDDVVSVSTQTNNSPLIWYEDGQAQSIPTHQRFALSVASGEQISVAVAAETLGIQSDSELIRAEDTIKIIRAKLREKKGGAVDSPDQGSLLGDK
jgi:hypothetical protein